MILRTARGHRIHAEITTDRSVSSWRPSPFIAKTFGIDALEAGRVIGVAKITENTKELAGPERRAFRCARRSLRSVRSPEPALVEC